MARRLDRPPTSLRASLSAKLAAARALPRFGHDCVRPTGSGGLNVRCRPTDRHLRAGDRGEVVDERASDHASAQEEDTALACVLDDGAAAGRLAARFAARERTRQHGLQRLGHMALLDNHGPLQRLRQRLVARNRSGLSGYVPDALTVVSASGRGGQSGFQVTSCSTKG